jgi:hypothetical protein
MLRPLVAVTAAAVLLTGCSGGDDKKSDSSGGDGNNSASAPTPTTPEVPSFDPPKAFAAVSALALPKNEATIGIDDGIAGMVGKAALYSNATGIVGHSIGDGTLWQVPATDVKTTKIIDIFKPVAVQLDGKEVIATGYVQGVEAGGTQKSHSQVAFQWIDPEDGKVVSNVTIDLTPVIGPGNDASRQISNAYDTSTGQVVVSVGVRAQSISQPSKYESVAVYADPSTKKATVIPSVEAAGVLNGTVVGVTIDKAKGTKGLSMVVADGPSGAIKKRIPTPTMNYLYAEGTGGKTRAYISGRGYVQDGKYDSHYVNSMYAVDIASGAVVETKMANTPEGNGIECQSDHVTGLLCTWKDVTTGSEDVQQIGLFDEATGKKTWSYSAKSASRVVPKVTAFYNGYVYGDAESLPAVLDAKTGQDVPVPTATPTPGATPTDGGSPTPGATTPTDDFGPTSGASGGVSGEPGTWGDTSLLYGDVRSPVAVSKYGSTYLLSPGQKAPLTTENILVVQKATS